MHKRISLVALILTLVLGSSLALAQQGAVGPVDFSLKLD